MFGMLGERFLSAFLPLQTLPALYLGFKIAEKLDSLSSGICGIAFQFHS